MVTWVLLQMAQPTSYINHYTNRKVTFRDITNMCYKQILVVCIYQILYSSHSIHVNFYMDKMISNKSLGIRPKWQPFAYCLDAFTPVIKCHIVSMSA